MKHQVLNKWESIPDLMTFKVYFEQQWLNSAFNKWQIYHTPPGFASTNNPDESFNKGFKTNFSNYHLLDLLDLVNLLKDHAIPYYSSNRASYQFSWQRQPTFKMKKLFKTFEMNEENFSVNNSYKNLIHYKGLNSATTIDINNKTCTCRWYNAYAMCAHLYWASAHLKFDLFEKEAKKFVYRGQRGKKKEAIFKKAASILIEDNDSQLSTASSSIASIELKIMSPLK